MIAYDPEHMSRIKEIPISVMVPPDGLSGDDEDTWGQEYCTTDPFLEPPEHIDISREVKDAFNRGYSRYVSNVDYGEKRRIDNIAKARKWKEQATEETTPSSRQLYLGFQRDHEKSAAKAAHIAKYSAEGARVTREAFQYMVEREVSTRREENWGHPDMPDLGLDFSAYEGMPEEAIRIWAKSQGVLEEEELWK